MTTDPLFMKIGADYYFYHNDHIGTPQKMTSVSGAVVWSAKYSSFGEASVDVGTVTNNLRFAGQYFDAESGLHYNFNRYYDPSLGRYIRADPIGFFGGINFFTYVQNNPVMNRDSKGLLCGSGLSDLLVPDAPAGFNFSSACFDHDNCYGTCQPDGANTSWGHKGRCDKQFHENLKGICRTEYDCSKECKKWADRYYWGVHNNSLAKRAYLNAQKNCDGCKELENIYYEIQADNNWPLITIYF
jgi:RHS repeat-associated protein